MSEVSLVQRLVSRRREFTTLLHDLAWLTRKSLRERGVIQTMGRILSAPKRLGVRTILSFRRPKDRRRREKNATKRVEVGKAFDFGDVGIRPVCTRWGKSRGVPIDRHYIERFLSRHQFDIRGNVLEIGDNRYTLQYGGDRVTREVVPVV